MRATRDASPANPKENSMSEPLSATVLERDGKRLTIQPLASEAGGVFRTLTIHYLPSGVVDGSFHIGDGERWALINALMAGGGENPATEDASVPLGPNDLKMIRTLWEVFLQDEAEEGQLAEACQCDLADVQALGRRLGVTA